jgi:3-oxoacyl-[acyl-carrier-protein] synthase II
MRGHAEHRQVVITGLGLVTPLGCDVETVWTNLVEGVSAVGPITRFDASGYPCRIAAEIHDFDPVRHMDARTARHVGRFCQYAIAASRLAYADSGLDGDVDATEMGVLVATGIGGLEEVERCHEALVERGWKRMKPAPMWIPNMASALVAIELGAGGPTHSLNSACASSGDGIGEAFEIIRRGDAEVMVAGGSEAAITDLALGAFCQIHALSRRNEEPARACRPFDAERDGFVMGEGAAMLVLEERGHARARNARVLAEVAGYGASCDMHHIVAPDPTGRGPARAIRLALQKAGVAAGDVGYVNAHAPSTPSGDASEVKALRLVFGERGAPPVSSTKSVTGHLLGAAGAMEAVACVLALGHRMIPPTMNFERSDPDCAIDCVPNQARAADLEVVISNSFGFGGHNCCLVFRRPADG